MKENATIIIDHFVYPVLSDLMNLWVCFGFASGLLHISFTSDSDIINI